MSEENLKDSNSQQPAQSPDELDLSCSWSDIEQFWGHREHWNKWKRAAAVTCCGVVAAGLTILALTNPVSAPQDMRDPAILPAAVPEETVSPTPGSAEEVAAPPVTPEPTPEPTPVPTPEPTPVPEPDFNNSVIIGSSTTEALYIYGSLPEPDYLYGTGLTVDSVFTETMPGSDHAIIDELAGKDYDKIFFSFGLNELGWPDGNVFIEHYKNMIARAREYLPNAEIYIESVLPVGIGTSQRNRFGVNQDRINEYNILLYTMAQEIGAHYLDVSTELKGEDGYLPQEASADGIHPNQETSDHWAQLLRTRVQETMAAPA